jgi:hypothetical protein
MFPPENVRLTEITTAESEVKQPKAKTLAVIDGTSDRSKDPSSLDDAEFWGARAAEAKAAEPQPEVTEQGWSNDGGLHGLFVLGGGVIIDDGPTERQISDWNIHNDHTDGLDFEAGS